MQHSNGFTLIEILVVLAIIAILSLLALPDKSGAIVRTQINESIKLIQSYKPLVEHIYKNTGQFPASNKAAGIPEADNIKGNYVARVNVENGGFHIVLGAKIKSDLNGKIISIRPIYIKDSPASPVSWVCGNDSIPQGMNVSGDNKTNVEQTYLPIICR